MGDFIERRPLGPDETTRLLGAEVSEPISVRSLEPFALRALAASVGKRLARERGRPTDKSWEISRKIPMKKATWEKLSSLSSQLVSEDIRVAPGQLAAVALESGIPIMIRMICTGGAPIARRELDCSEFTDDEQDEARALCVVANNESFW